jgi:hypothetical protein
MTIERREGETIGNYSPDYEAAGKAAGWARRYAHVFAHPAHGRWREPADIQGGNPWHSLCKNFDIKTKE